MNGVSTRGVRVQLGGRTILDDVSMQIDAGSCVAIVGASGVGKTTLLRAIAGLVPIDAGSILIDGRDVSATPPHDRRLGVVFQEPRLLPHLSALDNVALPLRARRTARSVRRRAAWNVLERVGVSHRAGARPSELSGGEQQRVALARALVHDPSVLMLDEPLSAVDAPLRGDLQRLILNIQEQRAMTMLIVTHDREEAGMLGSSTAVMVAGTIVQHADHTQLALRPATPEVARLIGSGFMIAPGSPLLSTLRLTSDQNHWVPAPALAVSTGHDFVCARVVRLRLGPGGWIATLDLSGTVAELAVPHHSVTVGDELAVTLDRSQITTFSGTCT